MKKQREEFLQNKQSFFKGELQYKEIVFEYNRKIMEKEKQLRMMRKKLDLETKNFHVKRTKKANEFKRRVMIDKLTKVDARAKYLKEDRSDFQVSRQLMVQKLKKDLELMRAGLTNINKIESDYHFLRNDQEFQSIMKELKSSLHTSNDQKAKPKGKVPNEVITSDNSSGLNIKAAMKVLRTATSEADLRKSKLGGSSPSPDKTQQQPKTAAPADSSKKQDDADPAAAKKQDAVKKAALDDAEKRKKITELQAKQVPSLYAEQRSPGLAGRGAEARKGEAERARKDSSRAGKRKARAQVRPRARENQGEG